MSISAKKYIVLLGDGMSDWPIESLGQKTPLEYAKTPVFDALAKKSIIGLVNSTPDSMSPGSDICNLSVMGYDPTKCHTGRSPLEAASIGIPLQASDTTFRCNFVTLSDEKNYAEKTMVDYSAEEISTEEANELIQAMNAHFKSEQIHFYTGTAYRHIMLWKNAPEAIALTPPHDISGQKIGQYLPGNDLILDITQKSYEILSNHLVNQKRVAKELRPANSVWMWGQGKKAVLEPFSEKFGLMGGVISAVDLVKGIAKSANMAVFPVEGATGNVHTNFAGKAKRAIEALNEGYDFVYIHVEAPDESSHRNELHNKLTSIEKLDEMAGFLYNALKEQSIPFSLMILPDHPTPLQTLTHARDPVPFLIYNSEKEQTNPLAQYTEAYAKQSGVFVDPGYMLMCYFTDQKSF